MTVRLCGVQTYPLDFRPHLLFFLLTVKTNTIPRMKIPWQYCGLKKDIQLESCELSFIWGRMRTAAWEAGSQIALRLLQSISGGKSIYEVLLKGEFNIMNHSIYKRFFVSHEDLMSP